MCRVGALAPPFALRRNNISSHCSEVASLRGTPHPLPRMRVRLVTWLVRFTAREDASAWVSLAVVGREPRAAADVVVKDVEAWVTLLSDQF